MMLGIFQHQTIWNLPHLLFTRAFFFSLTLLRATVSFKPDLQPVVFGNLFQTFLELGSSTLILALINWSGSGFCLGGPALASALCRRCCPNTTATYLKMECSGSCLLQPCLWHEWNALLTFGISFVLSFSLLPFCFVNGKGQEYISLLYFHSSMI